MRGKLCMRHYVRSMQFAVQRSSFIFHKLRQATHLFSYGLGGRGVEMARQQEKIGRQSEASGSQGWNGGKRLQFVRFATKKVKEWLRERIGKTTVL